GPYPGERGQQHPAPDRAGDPAPRGARADQEGPLREVDPERLARLRAATQLIHRPASATDPAEIARSIAGAQAQDLYAGPLTFRAPRRRFTAAALQRAPAEAASPLSPL